MTLGNFASYVYRRTGTTSSDWGASGADLVIALNNSNEHALSLIRAHSDNFYPTAWTTSDLSTGTATPVFDALFHELVPLRVCFQYAADNDKKNRDELQLEIEAMEMELLRFYSTRLFRIGTVTIASPGVWTLDNHGLRTNDRVILSSTGALPTGLSTATWYYIVVVTEHTFQLAATRSGTPINTSGSQSGTQYVGRETQARMGTGYGESNK